MKPKILLISDFAFPVTAGTERLVFGIADYFTNKLGIQTDILCPDWNNRGLFEEQSNVKIYRFKTHPITSSKPVKRIIDFVKKSVELQKYDIYHGFYTAPSLVSTVLSAKLRGAKSVITIFGREQISAQLTNPLKKQLVLSTLNSANAVTAYTWNVKDYLKPLFPKKEIQVTTGFVEKKFFTQQTQNQKEKTILFVGRMTQEKGIFILLEAFANLIKQTQAKLVLIGPPYQKELVEKKIQELSLEKNVSLLGFVSDKELNDWYNKASIVAVPAIFSDSFGLSLMEAIACKKPVVSTDSLGIPGITGEVIVQKNDPKSLEKALFRLFTDEKFYKEACLASEQMASYFDKDNAMNAYVEIYSKVLQTNLNAST